MGVPTERMEKNKFSKSVGAGLQAVMGNDKSTYYILEHKTNSQQHRPGKKEEIIVNYLELGRDPSCQIKFPDVATVSRKHAAITKEGGQMILKNLSTSNPTLINGRPVAKQYYLHNGDEIQLSMEGPKLGFIIPPNNKVSSIPLSRRLSLFRQQALRPYKQAITALSLIFLVSMSTLGYFLWQTKLDMAMVIEENKRMLATAQEFKGNVDSLQRRIQEDENTGKQLTQELERLRQVVASRPPAQNPPPRRETRGETTNTEATKLDPLFASVYYIQVAKIEIFDPSGNMETIPGNEYGWSGTGFLLKDGRFITARHVVEAWSYISSGEDAVAMQLNIFANNGGRVVAYFKALSPDGSSLSFKSSDFRVDNSSDRVDLATDNEGNQFMLRLAIANLATDWAVYASNKQGLIEADNTLSQNLSQQDKLHILGYPLGYGVSNSGVSPIYGSAIVSANGLQSGLIQVTDRNFESGNSGGPVFYLKADEQKYVVVGIVSASHGETTIGKIVPISSTN